MLFLTPTICFAKTIKIDRTYYNVDDLLELPGLMYDASTDTVTLTNANLISIQTDNDLNVILNGENTINNDRSVSACIKGNHVKILGNGTLNLISASRGISANTLEIYNTTLFGDVFTSMFVLTGDNPFIKINNSNIVFKDNESSFFIFNGGVDINDSTIVVLKTISLGNDTLKYININNSYLDIIESNHIFTGNSIINVDSNSKIFIYSKNEIDKNIFNGSNLKYLGSVDNENYHQDLNNDDKYLKIVPNNDLDKELEDLEKQKSLLEQEITKIEEKNKELIALENNNNQKEKDLINKELELTELSEGLNKKEEELMQKENFLNNSSNNLEVKESSINVLSNILLGKQDEMSNLEKNINNEKLEIESLKRYLSFKENELKEKENKLHLQNDDNSLNILEDKNNLNDQEEVLEDDIMENDFKYNNENVNYLNKFGNIFYLLISYISGIVTHIFTKRRING